MTVDGNLIGIPVRHATQGLFYNEALLEEAGISAPPTTLEELVEQADKLTFTSSAGTDVTGMVLASDLALFPVMFARAFGGDFITKDFELVPNPAAMEMGLNVLRAMFESGALPRTYATTRNDDQVTWMQQGRAAFTVLPFARNAQLNNPEQSNYPGQIKAIAFPGSEGLDGPMASIVEAWAMVIPKTYADKATAWAYIREVSSKANTIGMALNGNGPVRVSSYSDPGLIERNPLAEVEAQVLANARGAFPPFPEARTRSGHDAGRSPTRSDRTQIRVGRGGGHRRACHSDDAGLILAQAKPGPRLARANTVESNPSGPWMTG